MPALPWLPPCRQGLQAAKACCDVSGEGHRLATTLHSWRQPTGSQHAPRDGSNGAVLDAAGGAGRSRRRQWWRQSKPTGDFSLGAPVDCADHAAPTAAALYFLEPDTLGSELCVSVEAPTWVDPMLEELAASLVVSRLAGAKAAGCPSASVTVAQEDTSRVDTCSPVKELATLLVVSPLA